MPFYLKIYQNIINVVSIFTLDANASHYALMNNKIIYNQIYLKFYSSCSCPTLGAICSQWTYSPVFNNERYLGVSLKLKFNLLFFQEFDHYVKVLPWYFHLVGKTKQQREIGKKLWDTIPLTIDCQLFLIRKRQRSHRYLNTSKTMFDVPVGALLILESYKKDPHMPITHNRVGYWINNQGFEAIGSKNLWERRSDLTGVHFSITTLPVS